MLKLGLFPLSAWVVEVFKRVEPAAVFILGGLGKGPRLVLLESRPRGVVSGLGAITVAWAGVVCLGSVSQEACLAWSSVRQRG